jgi:DNA replication protein DnaC
MNTRGNTITEAHRNTFEWIFKEDATSGPEGSNLSINNIGNATSENTRCSESRSFVTWLRTGNDVFWISGKPGSGKSTLMRFLAHNSRTKSVLQSQYAGAMILAAFIWSAGSSTQRSQKTLFGSLLH